MESKQTMTPRHVKSTAEIMLDRVGEAVLQRIRQELPGFELMEEPLQFMLEVDSTSQPPSTELRFENTLSIHQLYGSLSSDRQFELFSALHGLAKHTLSRANPHDKLTERDVEVFVFDDQSAVELTLAQHRRNAPLLLPAVRAISWQQPMLLVGGHDSPIEINLYRLGYQEAIRIQGISLYRHYDPAMPLLGYGNAEGHFHLTVYNTGQAPLVVYIPDDPHGKGQFVDLRQPRMMSNGVTLSYREAKEHAIAYPQKAVPVDTRYPVALLEQVVHQFEVDLNAENAKRLLIGQKTDVIKTADGSTGKLYVLNTPDNGPQLVLQKVQLELTLKESYLGHIFSEKDKHNLHKYGDMGRAVALVDKQSGNLFTGFIGVDKDTKSLTVLRADQIHPKIDRMSHLKGVPLTSLQKQRLIEGKAIRLDNMISKAGTSFSAYVRVSASSRGLRFDHIPKSLSQENDSSGAPTSNESAGAAGKDTKSQRSGPEMKANS